MLVDKYKRRFTPEILLALPGIAAENKRLAAASQKQMTSDDIIGMALEADPTGRGKYTDWILKAWQRKAFLFEDLVGGSDSTVGSTLGEFEQYKKVPALKAMLPEENWSILKYRTPGDIGKAIAPISRHIEENQQSATGSREMKRRKSRKAHLSSTLHEFDSGLKITVPHTVEAAQFFGHRTRWCTSAQKNNAFLDYYNDGPLFIIETPDGEKFQAYINMNSGAGDFDGADYLIDEHDAVENEVLQLLDEMDRTISEDQSEKLMTYRDDIIAAMTRALGNQYGPGGFIIGDGVDVLLKTCEVREDEDEPGQDDPESAEIETDETFCQTLLVQTLLVHHLVKVARKKNRSIQENHDTNAESRRFLEADGPSIKVIKDRSGFDYRIVTSQRHPDATAQVEIPHIGLVASLEDIRRTLESTKPGIGLTTSGFQYTATSGKERQAHRFSERTYIFIPDDATRNDPVQRKEYDRKVAAMLMEYSLYEQKISGQTVPENIQKLMINQKEKSGLAHETLSDIMARNPDIMADIIVDMLRPQENGEYLDNRTIYNICYRIFQIDNKNHLQVDAKAVFQKLKEKGNLKELDSENGREVCFHIARTSSTPLTFSDIPEVDGRKILSPGIVIILLGHEENRLYERYKENISEEDIKKELQETREIFAALTVPEKLMTLYVLPEHGPYARFYTDEIRDLPEMSLDTIIRDMTSEILDGMRQNYSHILPNLSHNSWKLNGLLSKEFQDDLKGLPFIDSKQNILEVIFPPFKSKLKFNVSLTWEEYRASAYGDDVKNSILAEIVDSTRFSGDVAEMVAMHDVEGLIETECRAIPSMVQAIWKDEGMQNKMVSTFTGHVREKADHALKRIQKIEKARTSDIKKGLDSGITY